ncbi:MAG: SMC-Scp complex subunit ScpB [Clostridia bacterium]|nr:SMC-Scp complex subunit ScpB [Clostridia bacterium]
MDSITIAGIMESILFANGDAVDIDYINEKLLIAAPDEAALAILRAKYSGNSGILLMEFNGKLQFCTNPLYIKEVSDVLNPIREKELTNTVLETLAIIAYKQPITRTEIEEIRGVDCTYGVQTLSKLELIEVVGRKDAIGKPLLLGTTDTFLKRFSLKNVDCLPDYDRVMQILAEKQLNSIDSDLFNIHGSGEAAEIAIDESINYDREGNIDRLEDEKASDSEASAKGYSVSGEEGEVSNSDDSENSIAESLGDEIKEGNAKGNNAIEDANADNCVDKNIAVDEHKNNEEMSFEEDIPDFLKGEDITHIGG